MIFALTILLGFQLAGEVASRGLGLTVPGPVLGMVGLFAALMVMPGLAMRLRETATGLLGHLSLLFVPAGVGIVAHLDRLQGEGVGLILAIVGSTVLTLLVAVSAFLAVARLTGGGDE